MSPALYFGIAVLAGGISGVLCVILWVMRARQDRRAERIQQASAELIEALDSARKVLRDERTPTDVRQTIFMLLEAIAEPSFGDVFSKTFAEVLPDLGVPEGPLVAAMHATAEIDASLEREAHRAMVGILLGLMYLHGRQIFAAQSKAATDPDTIWTRISRVLGKQGGKTPPDGHALPA